MTALARKTDAPPAKMTVEAFLAWAEGLPDGRRYELVRGEPVAMSPERARHAQIKYRIARALEDAIAKAGVGCHMLPDGMTVPIDDETAYEPDALVYCGEPLPGDAVVVPEPLIVVEVLSPGTAHIDSGAKFHHYLSLESVRHYLVIDADAKTIMHHRRDGGGGDTITTAIIRDGTFTLEPPGITIAHEALFG